MSPAARTILPIFSFIFGLLAFWHSALLGQSPSPAQQAEAHSRQAQQYLMENRPDQAIREFRAILALEPENIAVRANLGTLLYFQEDYSGAAGELRAAIQAQPTLWKTETLLGMCEKRLGNLAAARSDLETAFPNLTEEKLRVQAGMELVELYYASRDLDKADDILSALRKLKPDDPAILYTAHRIYAEQADEATLRVALVAPKSAWIQQIIAEEMMTQGNVDAALAHYRAALKLDDRLPGLHFEFAEVLSASSSSADKEQAQKEYEIALAQNPFDEKAECRLGKFALARSDLKTALAYYSRALQLQPEDQDANLGVGKVLLAMNQPHKAESALQRAVQADPSDAATHYNLGTLYRQLGRMEDAKREFAEFQRLKQAKEDLKGLYQAMRLPKRPDDDTPENAP